MQFRALRRHTEKGIWLRFSVSAGFSARGAGFLELCIKGMPEQITKSIKAGASVSERNENVVTTLTIAAIQNTP